MCIGFEPVFTYIDLTFSIIDNYQINRAVHIYVNANYVGPANATPELDMQNLTDAERAMINCTITLRDDIVQDAYNGIANAGRVLIIKEGAPGYLGTWSKDVMNGTETIELNREINMKHARDLYPSDSAAQEKTLHLKVMAETYIHELCHSAGKSHTEDESNSYMTPQYYSTKIGRCERDAFVDVFQETPPSYNKTFPYSNPPDYVWNVTCMSSIKANNTNYFNSLHSGVAAWDVFPTYSMEYHSGPNPN